MKSFEQIVLFILAGSLGSGIASFYALRKLLSGYVAEKGKNLATREDFKAILEQLKISTRETESIRLDLSGLSWMRQQYWGKREQYYMELLSELTKLHIALADGLSCYDHPDSVYDNSITDSEHYKAMMKRSGEAYARIQELTGPAAVFLSDHAVQTLRSLIGDYWDAADMSSNALEFLSLAFNNVDHAYAEILAEAKTELMPDKQVST